MKRFTIFLYLLLTAFFSFAQNSYWQQEVNYNIKVKLNDEQHMLYAFEEVEYINNSPDHLEFIWFHLWPNAYKNTNTAFTRQQIKNGATDFYFADDSQRGYIDSLNFSAKGKTLKWEYHPQHIDIAKVHLSKPLAPGEKIIISTPFRVKLPNSFSRLGHVGQQYQITQWYPKPAVYDEEGWHPMPYLDQGEFYSEFGKFEVSITLPETYVVGATGSLTTEKEIRFLDSLASTDKEKLLEQQASDSISASEETDEEKIEEESVKRALKTISYTQDRVHDFAWFADQTYHVLKGEVKLPETGKVVQLYAFFNKENYAVWKDILQYMEDATYYYSEWIGEYPYDVVSVVDGALSAGAGMEYPTITVLGANSPFALDVVTTHEIGHNWFYGILGTNERVHTWMDEGINSLYEKRYVTAKYPDKQLSSLVGLEKEEGISGWLGTATQLNKIHYTRLSELGYLINARRNFDQPLDIKADEFTSTNYGTMVYMKTAMAFNHLMHYLGQEEFDRIMKKYYKQWQFKHPKPEDLRKLFEIESGKNLDWLFDDQLKSTKKIDYKIKNLAETGEGFEITLQNKKSIAAPVPIVALAGNDTVVHKFIEGFSGLQTVQMNNRNIDKVLIDPAHNTLDLYRNNNQAYLNKLWKKAEPFEIGLIGGIDAEPETRMNILPVIGANTRDNLMLGAVFYNNVFPPRKLNYRIMPMYSFGLKQLAGSAEVDYSVYPSNVFQKITFNGAAKQYAGYKKVAPGISFLFMPRNLQSNMEQSLDFKYTAIDVDTRLLPNYLSNYQILSGAYKLSTGNVLTRYKFGSEVQMRPQDFIVWKNEAKVTHQYKENRYLSFNLFYGQFLNNDNIHPSFLLRMSGSTDYLMETTFLDRAQISSAFTAFDHQTDLRDGGFKAFVPESLSDTWLGAANVEVDLPFTSLISIYGDVGFLSDNTYYGSGLKIGLPGDILALYFPIVGSNYNGVVESFSGLQDNIRFSLNLSRINPFDLIRNIGY